jgi:AbrB family looped-hinge helix DNA binding protein
MLQKDSVITRKGQVTLPIEIRRELGLKEGDRVTFKMENGTVVVARAVSVVDATAGIFNSRKPAPSVKELREMAEEAWVEEAKS